MSLLEQLSGRVQTLLTHCLAEGWQRSRNAEAGLWNLRASVVDWTRLAGEQENINPLFDLWQFFLLMSIFTFTAGLSPVPQ